MAMPRKPLMQYLMDQGYLTKEQADEAAKVQQQTGQQDVGKVVINLGFAAERHVLEARAQEQGVGFIDLDKVQVDSSAVNMVPERICKTHTVMPVKKDGMTIYVAMSNLLNIQAQDDIRMITGCRVIPVMAVTGAIEDAIKKYYATESAKAEQAGGAAPAAAPAAQEAQVNMSGDMRRFMAEAAVGRGKDDDDDAGQTSADDKMAEAAPIIKLANALIQQAIVDRASDIHVEPQQRGVRVRYRIDGVLMEAMNIPKNLQAPMISRLKIMADMNIAERRIPQDGRIEVRNAGKEYDLRVSSIPTPFGEKIVMRILDKSSVMIGLDKLAFAETNQAIIEEIITQPNGMFLCTGPTGSGKTTTQYSVLNKLNTIGVNIVTVEDPVEYQLPGIAQVQVNKKAGLTFGNALRAFLRQDPDIIMVGEMRDLETAEIAIESSLTGHLVLSTLHTNDAPSATLRLIDMGIEPYLISATVIGVLAQRLGRRIDPDNKEPYTVKQIDLRRFGFEVTDPDAEVTLYRGIPSDHNRQTGYRGRMGFHELMVMNAEIAELVVRRAPLQDIKMAAKANGMKELKEDGLLKVMGGQTTPEEVMRVVFTAGF